MIEFMVSLGRLLRCNYDLPRVSSAPLKADPSLRPAPAKLRRERKKRGTAFGMTRDFLFSTNREVLPLHESVDLTHSLGLRPSEPAIYETAGRRRDISTGRMRGTIVSITRKAIT